MDAKSGRIHIDSEGTDARLDTRRARLMALRCGLVLSIVLLVPIAPSHRTHAEEHAFTMSMANPDRRTPLPLLPMMAEHQKQNMREHLAAVQAIIAALGRDDLDSVATAAGRIGYSEAMGQMCEHMGAAAPEFTTLALAFHHTADGIAEAARKGDRAGVLTALDRTLQACVECHATYRQEIVDEGTWKRLTAGVPGHSSAASP